VAPGVTHQGFAQALGHIGLQDVEQNKPPAKKKKGCGRPICGERDPTGAAAVGKGGLGCVSRRCDAWLAGWGRNTSTRKRLRDLQFPVVSEVSNGLRGGKSSRLALAGGGSAGGSWSCVGWGPPGRRDMGGCSLQPGAQGTPNPSVGSRVVAALPAPRPRAADKAAWMRRWSLVSGAAPGGLCQFGFHPPKLLAPSIRACSQEQEPCRLANSMSCG